jgi:hypothetical protein
MPRSRRPSVSFVLDARIELLSALILLARPRPIRLPYADKARKHLGAFAKHPAVAELRRLLDRGVPEHLFAEIILLQPDAGGLLTPELAAFFELLRDFAARSGAAAFFKARKKAHAGFVSLARAEAAKSQRPEDISAYMRMPFPGTCRLILAPLLPRAFAVNVSRGGTELRVRNGSFGRGGLTFEYDAFDCCVAHELTHTLVTPLIEGSRQLFDSYPGLPPKQCRDSSSWSGCVEEHLVRAITLRALKLSGDGKSYQAILRRWSRSGYPYLQAFCASLESFERSPKTSDFAAFYPGLISAFKA